MSINNINYKTFTISHHEDIPEQAFLAMEQRALQSLNQAKGEKFKKTIPEGLKKEVKAAKKQLKQICENRSSKTTKDALVKKATGFNHVVTEGGKTTLYPIGALALACLKKSSAVSEAKGLVVNNAFSLLLEEYITHHFPVEEQMANLSSSTEFMDEYVSEAECEEDEAPSETLSPSFSTSSFEELFETGVLPSSFEGEENKEALSKTFSPFLPTSSFEELLETETLPSSVENVDAALEAPTPSVSPVIEEITKDSQGVGEAASEAAGRSAASNRSPGIEKTPEAEEAKEAESAKGAGEDTKPKEKTRAKNTSEKVHKPKTSFWVSIGRFFKNIIMGIIKLFTGNKNK